MFRKRSDWWPHIHPGCLHFHSGWNASKFDPFKGKLRVLPWKVSKFFGFRIIKQELSFQVGSLFSGYTKLICWSKWNFAHIGNSLRLPSFRPCGGLSKYLHDSSLSDGKYFLYFHSIKFMVYITVKNLEVFTICLVLCSEYAGRGFRVPFRRNW